MGRNIFLTENQLKHIILNSAVLNEDSKKTHYSMKDKLEHVYDPNVVDGGNFPIKRNGKIYWVSRSMVVSLYVFGRDLNGRKYILASKRGPGAHGGNNCWNVVCGYLDYGETLEQTAVREAWEECGIKINPNELISAGINSENETVSARFYTILKQTIENMPTSINNCEKGEVVKAAWIPIDELHKHIWWKNQDKKILQFAERLFYRENLENTNQNMKNLVICLDALIKDGIIEEKDKQTIINFIKR